MLPAARRGGRRVESAASAAMKTAARGWPLRRGTVSASLLSMAAALDLAVDLAGSLPVTVFRPERRPLVFIATLDRAVLGAAIDTPVLPRDQVPA